ncbi:hypothetical protein FACS189472_16540 [Alphaproteobacteria bacterium]|nr:hypothetical protein FACS189472_16540 [Alphaproteobacteria bacterium]
MGKNFFTNVLSTMLKGYALPNITDLSHVVGHFNELIRGKVLIVVNEVENAHLNPRSLSEKLRSMITDDIIVIAQKHKTTTLDVNCANFILVSNNDVPVRLGMNDRHYLCTRVSSKKVRQQTNSAEFYQALTQFFKRYDLNQYRPNDDLMNRTKRAILTQGANQLDSFVIDNYNKLCVGMYSDQIAPMIFRYHFPTKQAFWKQLAPLCDIDDEGSGSKRRYLHRLKDLAALKYMSIASSVGSEADHVFE